MRESHGRQECYLDSKVKGENFFLECHELRHWQCLEADFGHDEALEGWVNDLTGMDASGSTYLVELGTEESAIGEKVIRCQGEESVG